MKRIEEKQRRGRSRDGKKTMKNLKRGCAKVLIDSIFENPTVPPSQLTNEADQHVPQRELDRITAAEQNQSIKTKLEMLTRELEVVKDERAVTDYDVLHMENKRAGRDKYKTLRQIRGGNTKRRIDQYENM
ncbi:Ezrin/radixin/moesin family protein [Ancylostoma duodenale]|uniref:Ezrin/radixin/moesin family protein n=1 Tax=Ancylostoma duodenale TaxID=51022 RepID=A0A0C2DSU0_9BILA|nr:Ezrin/radixin/moesin family protein [Ancylostoma duodenale]